MQLSKLVKGVMLALPIVAVTACSSTNTAGTKTADTKTAVAETNSSSSGLSSAQLKTLEKLQKQNNSIVYFDFDKYSINSNFTKLLDQHAEFLRTNPAISVVVEGHADERGTPEYNIALGERRANAVKAYLQSRGVIASQISTISYGKEKLVAFGHNNDAHAKNRRAVIVY